MNTCHIKPPNNQPGVYWFALSLAIILAIGIVSVVVPTINNVALSILLLFSVTFCIIAFKQMHAPSLSFTLTFMHWQYHSAEGGWSIRWHNIQKLGVAEIANREGWYRTLPWVGVRLKDYDEFLLSVCPRVASKMLIDQRGLLLLAYKQTDNSPHAIEDMLFDDSHYTTHNGVVLKGLIAMLANRMRYNRELLGYDFFVSDDLFDRPVSDFVGLARRYLAQAQSY
ncbi:hypothetical protein A3K86_04705 [Photobacterium jeanii]|uniref:DUF2982 domain-containing protein n=1 Tax=Photobacterium jeanii TaxID=858640 RepID=A0A178KNR2_9GAMM|nr:DUF2982 domain-containing protein [Photobacterium jeanii]OAN18202.1 hypothetical protein A3K86_04705 [Photobacterium jeanii]PST92121.1 DUF2982 domain-containing protein [Photobacterium jeanii]